MKEFWNNLFLVNPAPEPGWTVKRRELYYAWRIFMVFCAGLCMGLALLVLAVGPYSKRALIDYLCHWQTLLLNTLPVGLLVLLFYGVTGRTGAAFLLGGGIALGFSLGNYYKLQFRDDPLYFEDMLILREAKAMASGDHYSLFFDNRIIAALSCLLLGAAAAAGSGAGKALVEAVRLRPGRCGGRSGAVACAPGWENLSGYPEFCPSQPVERHAELYFPRLLVPLSPQYFRFCGNASRRL